jgi:hypothetical protein
MRAATEPAAQSTDTLVVTCRVPVEHLELDVLEHTVYVTGPGGFAHELELPLEADMDKLEIELFRGFLELRAPRRSEHQGGLS